VYKPYFFIPYPLSPQNHKIIEELNLKTKIVEKNDLFSGQLTKITKIQLESFSNYNLTSEKFDKSWEAEVPFILSYVYDKGLTFGAKHQLKANHLNPIYTIPTEVKQNFEEKYREIKATDPTKYALLKRWFVLCTQSIPHNPSKKLNLDAKLDPEQYYLSFILSRVANIPLPMAYSNRHVSTWIKSILHNYLRRNKILIPSSKELRKGETKKHVQGALTFPPKPGVYFNTLVMDFESLYPSLIDAYNLSYETINCSHQECQDNHVPKLEHNVCTLRRGVYSILIGAIKDLRIHWFKPLSKNKTIQPEARWQAKTISQLFKLILVSSYGVTIRIRGLSRPSVAESITAYGRHSLQTTYNLAKEKGLHPIYGDTDSLFLDNPSIEQVQWLINTVKDRFHLILAVDEKYSICILPKAMKAYFGIRMDGTPDIKGVTAIKSNSPPFIENLFKDCVREMIQVTNWREFTKAKQRIQRIIDNALTDLQIGVINKKDLTYIVKLHEDPQKKMREIALHQPYQCALQLIDNGKTVQRGDTVAFIKVQPFTYRNKTFTVKPLEQFSNMKEINVKAYTRNLKTALNQTFKPMNLNFTYKNKKNVTLSDYF
jgi:DNA polymerase I